MEFAGRVALYTNLDPLGVLSLRDPFESMITQVIVQSAEEHVEKLLDSLALKIRNQIAEMLNTGN